MELEEAIKILKYQLANRNTDVYTPINYEAMEVVLNHITKQEKMIGLMTNFIYHIGYYEDNYGNSCAIIQDSCFKNKTTESCEECIKQYFEKKAEENK